MKVIIIIIIMLSNMHEVCIRVMIIFECTHLASYIVAVE